MKIPGQFSVTINSYGISCHVCVLRPASRGSVTLQDADPRTPPRIDPQFLSTRNDLEMLLKGVRRTHEIMSSAPLAKHITTLHTIKGNESDKFLERIIRDRADTIYFPSSGILGQKGAWVKRGSDLSGWFDYAADLR